MRDFSKISPKLWRSARFRSLPSEDAKLAYLYVLTCGHQTSAGCFCLPPAYGAADLNWPEERFSGALNEAACVDLLVVDPATDELFVRRWFRHNPPTNPKHLKGIERLISEMDSDAVREAAEEELAEYQDQPNVTPLAQPPRHGLTSTNYLAGKR